MDEITAGSPTPVVTTADTKNRPPAFCSFQQLTINEVPKLRKLKISPTVDLLRLTMFESIYDLLLPSFQHIINNSLSTGVFPKALRQAVITPLLKSDKANPEELSSYRPVSNIPFLSKLIETSVSLQLSDHFDQHSLLHANQSAYRRYHSVESVLTAVSSSILESLDNNHTVLFLMLDLSAAFDTVKHELLLNTLNVDFGITGTPLLWLRSYLSDRSFKVKCQQSMGTPFKLTTGVPQGSILGPLLFNTYMTDLFRQLDTLNVSFHNYADDIQLWSSYDPKSVDGELQCRERIRAATDLIIKWMHNHYLKLNCAKTVFLPISRCSTSGIKPMTVGTAVVPPSAVARNLGFLFDAKFNFQAQISHVRKTAFLQLRRLQFCKPFVPPGLLPLLVHAFITSRLDFCNCLYINLPKNQLVRLQSVLNASAKFLTGARKFDSSREALAKLHWLPICQRIVYKVCTMSFHLFHNTPRYPSYFSAISPRVHQVKTRTSATPQLSSSFKSRLKSCGDRSFSSAAVSCFNSLPPSIRSISSYSSFKSNLKTHLFST